MTVYTPCTIARLTDPKLIDCGPDGFQADAIGALLRGLSSQSRHVFYIGTSGASRIWDESRGQLNPRVWDDVDDIDEILSRNANHADTDTLVLSSNTATIHTALVSPGYVTGVSPSKSHLAPLLYPDLFDILRRLGAGFAIDGGNNRISFVEVNHLAAFYICLIKDALQRLSDADARPGDLPIWGPQAYYFAANSEHSAREFVQNVVRNVRGQSTALNLSDETKHVSHDEVAKIIKERVGDSPIADLWGGYIANAFSVNMRAKGTRAERVFGWEWRGNDGVAESARSYLDRNFS